MIMTGKQPIKNETTLEAINVLEKNVLVSDVSSDFLYVILGAVVIFLVLVTAMIIRWIYRKRKYNRLRHFLIPTYTFDPNEEETWDADIDNQESSIFAGSSPQGIMRDTSAQENIDMRHTRSFSL